MEKCGSADYPVLAASATLSARLPVVRLTAQRHAWGNVALTPHIVSLSTEARLAFSVWDASGQCVSSDFRHSLQA